MFTIYIQLPLTTLHYHRKHMSEFDCKPNDILLNSIECVTRQIKNKMIEIKIHQSRGIT